MTQVLPPPPAPAYPLRRSTGDRLIGGVCGGLGRRYGIDPVILRVVFVVAVFASGVGALVYLALWLLLPADNDPAPDPLTRNVLALVVGLLVAFGALMTAFGWLGSLGAFTGVLVGAVLVGLVVWLMQQNTRSQQATMNTSAPSPEWTPPTGFAYGGTGAPTTPPAPPTGPFPPYPPAPPRERSYLGLITVLAAIVVGAGMATLSAAGIWSVGAAGGLAAVLGVLAIGLLIGAIAGRARWLIVLALPLALTVAAVAHVAPILSDGVPGGVGQRTWAPTAPGHHELGLGDATLDLTRWAASTTADQPTGQTVSAELGVGELSVVVPRTWAVTVDAQIGVGRVSLNGERVGGNRPDESVNLTLPATGEPTGELHLVLDTRVGDIDIQQRTVAELPVPEQRTPDQDRSTADRSPAAATTKENAR